MGERAQGGRSTKASTRKRRESGTGVGRARTCDSSRQSGQLSSDGNKGTRRKRLEDIVTAANIESMVRSVEGAFGSVDASLSEPADQEERERRERVYEQAAVLLRRAVLTYLRERDPSTFRTILSSVLRCAREAIEKGKRVEFRIVRPRPSETFWGAVTDAQALGLYEKVIEGLKGPWRDAESAPVPFAGSHYVSHKGRYGPPQVVGAARRRATVANRANALLKTARKILSSEVLAHRPLDEERATRWVRAEKKLAGTLHRFLGYLFGKEPRTIKLMLTRARKARREAPAADVVVDGDLPGPGDD